MLKSKEYYKNKKVLVRVDYNVPMNNGKIEDNNRIIESLKTINYLISSDAKIILMSHLGKVKSEEDKKNNSLFLVSKELSKLLKIEVKFCDKTRGVKLEGMINALNDGEILLIENTRYEDYPDKLESSCNMELSKYWANLFDEFVMDAFGSIHREHASTYGIASILSGCTGFLVDKEINILKEALNNKNKVLLLGGAKVEDKLGVIFSLAQNSKKILIGGGMCFTFLKALNYNIGSSLCDNESVEKVKNILYTFKEKIVLPIDIKTNNGIKNIKEFSNDDIGLDIGNNSIKLFKSIINKEDLVVWNGPMGKFEEKEYESGTKELLKHLNSSNIKTIICGGDTGNAVKKYGLNFYYVSTGGGASLEFLEGKKFKILEVLNK